MADDIDRAQITEERDREMALQAVRARIESAFSPRDASAAGRCIDCLELIEPERMKALRGCTSRCVACAAAHEHRLKGRRTA